MHRQTKETAISPEVKAAAYAENKARLTDDDLGLFRQNKEYWIKISVSDPFDTDAFLSTLMFNKKYVEGNEMLGFDVLEISHAVTNHTDVKNKITKHMFELLNEFE